MNEPNTQTATEWVQGANAAIQAIRDQGATQKILVSGSYWDGAHSWTSTDNDTVMLNGVTDPLHNFNFEVHQYLDSDFSGEHTTVVPGAGATVLQSITDWARTNHQQLFLGEYGFAADAASMKEGQALVDYMHANADVWMGSTYWAAGPWWDNYAFSVEPVGSVDKPQMKVLDTYLG
jgi:endoglucanase